MPGSLKVVDKIMKGFERGDTEQCMKVLSAFPTITPHDCAAVIKRLVREQEHPLIPEKAVADLMLLYEEHRTGGDLTAIASCARSIEPRINRACLHRIVLTLSRVATAAETTRMNSTNIAIVLAASLFQISHDSVLGMSNQAGLVVLLVDNCEKIFGVRSLVLPLHTSFLLTLTHFRSRAFFLNSGMSFRFLGILLSTAPQRRRRISALSHLRTAHCRNSR